MSALNPPFAHGPAGEHQVGSWVPSYPVIRLSIELPWSGRVAGSGADGDLLDGELVEGLVDGKVIVIGTWADVRERLVREAAAVAAGRPCGAVRALTSGFETDSDSQHGQVRPVVVAVTSDGVVVPLGELIRREPGRKVGRRQLLSLVGVAVLSAGAVGGLSWVAAQRAGRGLSAVPIQPLAVTPVRVQLPVLPPVGYARVALWSVALPTGMSRGGVGAGGVVTDAGVVWVPSTDRKGVEAVDVATGGARWARVVGDTLVGGPVVATVGDQRCVVVWTSSEVVVLHATTGEVLARWPLPAPSMRVLSVGAGGAAGVVAVGQGQHVEVLTSQGWVSRVVPAGAAVVGVQAKASAEGTVVAAGGGRVWVVSSSSVAGEGTPVPPPAGATWLGPVGMVGDLLVAAFTPRSAASGVAAGGVAGGVVLRGLRAAVAHAAGGGVSTSWAPVWTSPIVPGSAAGGVALGLPGVVTGAMAVSPGGDWGIYGSSVINLRSGGVHPLPSDWVTSCLGQDGAFGTTGGKVVTVGADGRLGPGAPGAEGAAVPPTPGAGNAVPPVAVASWPTSRPAGPAPVEGSAGVGVALVVAQDGPSTALYAVPALGLGGDGR